MGVRSTDDDNFCQSYLKKIQATNKERVSA